MSTAVTLRTRSAILAAVVAVVWLGFGTLRFDQGLDLAGQGRWVLGAALEASGTAVHSQIDTGDGPLPYQVLGTWMRLAGESYGAAGRVQTMLHALVAVLLFAWASRRGFTAGILTQLGLLAAAPLPFAASWAGLTLLIPALLPQRLKPALVFGMLAAGLASISAAWFLVIVFIAGMMHRELFRPAVTGFAIGTALVLAHALTSGAVAPTLSNAIVQPWSELIANGTGRVFSTLRSGAWLDLPFAGLATGEQLGPAWPGHALMRATGLRLAGLLVLAGPIIIVWKSRPRCGLPLWISIGAAGLVLLRGDVSGILAAMLLSTAAWIWSDLEWRRIAFGLIALAMLVPAAENTWLVKEARREGLELWATERVGVRLDAARARSLRTAIREMHLHAEQPALIWPDLAGLHFLLGSEPVVRSLVPAGDESASRALQATTPPVVLLAPHASILPQNLERALPLTATELRRNYRLRGALPAGGLNLRAFERGGGPEDPLAARLPRIECMVAPSVQELSPALRDDLAIGQSFRIEDDDFRGFAIRLVTTADSVAVQLRARLWERPGVKYNSLLAASTVKLVARRDKPMHWVEFPVVDTAGRDLALVFETMDTPAADVRFAWHEDASTSDIGDLYPWGSAMLDLEPVAADLVILVY